MTDKIAATPGQDDAEVECHLCDGCGEVETVIRSTGERDTVPCPQCIAVEIESERKEKAARIEALGAALESIATTAEDMGGKTPAQRCAMIAGLARAALAKAQAR